MSLFEIEIDPRIRNITVEGQKNIPVKRFEVVNKDKKKKKKKDSDKAKDDQIEVVTPKNPILRV
jgi:hypothetical protein